MTEDRSEQHYLIERELADRIRRSGPSERSEVTRQAYDDLFQRVPWHPDFQRTQAQLEAEARSIASTVGMLARRAGRILDLGCGYGHFAMLLASRYPLAEVVGIEISPQILLNSGLTPPNCHLQAGDIVRPALGRQQFDLAVCSQVVEHLHPDTVPAHLAEVQRLLRAGGTYVIETPNRNTGPYDVSRGRDPIATGFHLKEWTYGELVREMHRAGFTSLRTDIPIVGLLLRGLRLPVDAALVPAMVKIPIEWLVGRIPGLWARHFVGRILRVNGVLIYGRAP